MTDPALSLALRASVTVTTLALVITLHRALRRSSSASLRESGSRAVAVALGVPFAIAAGFAHIALLRDTLMTTFPIGFGLGIAAALATLAWRTGRAAFDALTDADLRLLLSFRGFYGALLLGLAAIGHMPLGFALSAGLGDLLVAWLALSVPTSLAAHGPRGARLLIHGLGLADIVQVVVLAVLVVRPWSVAHDNAVTSMTLPWVAVPLMLALSAHGLRQAWSSAKTEPERDRSQPAGRLRSSVS